MYGLAEWTQIIYGREDGANFTLFQAPPTYANAVA